MGEPERTTDAAIFAAMQARLESLEKSHVTAKRRARIQTWVLGLGLIFASTWAAATAFNLGSSNNVPSTFAYEGTLVINGAKVTGSYDMKFSVVDASAVEHDFELTGVSVSDGKFAVEIGPLNQSQFDGGDGDDILLKIAVKQNGSYVPLGSGQKLTSVPFAAKASKAVGADAFEAASIKVGNVTHAHVPVGTIVAFWGATAPSGWLLCDGQTDLSTDSKYDALETLVGGTVPDLRGRFLRGLDDRASDDGSKVDPDAPRTLGVTQTDAFQGHKHHLGFAVQMADTPGYGFNAVSYRTGVGQNGWTSDVYNSSAYGAARVATETRPTNIAVSYIIKY